jgi:hypothetical protein
MLFENGILNLTNWLGNVILPTLAGVFFTIAIVRFVGQGQHQHWIYAGFLSLMVSGLLRGLETFSTQQAWNDPDLYWIALMSMVNWLCNVIMPLYGVLQICTGIVHFAGIGFRMYQGGSWMRHFVAAGCCFMLSGIIRLAEWFVQHGLGGVS